MAKLNFGGVEETVITREEFPSKKHVKSSRTKPSQSSAMVSKAPVRDSISATTVST